MVSRVQLTDGSGGWFDRNKALVFDEATVWDGRNHISVATGNQWHHESLLFTQGRRWVLNCSSQWQGSLDSYEPIREEEAIRWLAQNDHFEGEAFDKLPPDIRERVAAGQQELEL